jgi:Transposase and inactivated derivatives
MKKYKSNSDYYSSSHSVYKCSYHIVLCPKYRHKILRGKISERLREIVHFIAKMNDFIIEEIEADKDHVHMIIICNPRFGIMKCVNLIKSSTARTLFSDFPILKTKYLWGGKFWSRSTFVATVGSVSLEVVKRYIENQGKT